MKSQAILSSWMKFHMILLAHLGRDPPPHPALSSVSTLWTFHRQSRRATPVIRWTAEAEMP